MKMHSDILKVLQLKNYFNIISLENKIAKYTLKGPSKILVNNIYIQWLKSIRQKTEKHFPVYINESVTPELLFENGKKIPLGYSSTISNNKDNVMKHDLSKFLPKQCNVLKLDILMPQSEIMQYFHQWQRHRKYWWSSITTSAGLISISDIKDGDNLTEVEILAHLPWGPQIVENINIYKTNDYEKLQKVYKRPVGRLESSMTMEGALITLLIEGLINCTPEGFIRLNRTMAPYKLGFAIHCNGEASSQSTLLDLIKLLNSKVLFNKISTWLPDFSLSLQDQLLSSQEIGAVYIAIISESILSNGVFHLMNNSTMLTEQIHVADFEAYVKVLFKQ